MDYESFEGYMKAISPISHGSHERIGNDIPLKRWVWNLPERTEIPGISANTIRNGGLRRFLMADMLNQLDYKLGSKTILQFLFAGGILEEVSSKDSGVLNLNLRKELRETLPPLALLGGTLGNQNFDGLLDVAFPKLVCEELKEYLPSLNHEFRPAAEYTSWDTATTHDPLNNMKLSNYLKEDNESEDKSVQMIYNWETFNPGTLFTLGFVLKTEYPLIRSCFIRSLNLWNHYSIIGGKMGTGHGKIKICLDYDHSDEIVYLNYLQNNKKEIITTLDSLCGDWKP